MGKDDVEIFLKELHDQPAISHYGGETTTHKILLVGYYMSKLFKDVHTYAQKCKSCQTTTRREMKLVILLQPISISHLVQQWGINIICEIAPNFSKQHKYILTSTY